MLAERFGGRSNETHLKGVWDMEQTVISTDGRNDGAAMRRHDILKRNRELIEHRYILSADKDIAFLIFELSPGMKLPADVAAFVVKSVQSSMIPTQVIQAPRWTLYRMLRRYQRELHRTDRRNPKESRIVEQLRNQARPNHFWTVVVAQKGKQAVEFPAPDANQARP